MNVQLFSTRLGIDAMPHHNPWEIFCQPQPRHVQSWTDTASSHLFPHARAPRRGMRTDIGAVAFLLLAVRAAIGLSGYSGEGNPPMHGDFEAQRHWMEVTTNLPPTRWYVHGPDNDLQYWGLDYPPLSAHASWLVGTLARALGRPELVALHASRGIETPEGATRAELLQMEAEASGRADEELPVKGLDAGELEKFAEAKERLSSFQENRAAVEHALADKI